jgi:hypothetical protein
VRILVRCICICSLFLGVVTLLLWGRCYFVGDDISHLAMDRTSLTQRAYVLVLNAGTAYFSKCTLRFSTTDAFDAAQEATTEDEGPPGFHWKPLAPFVELIPRSGPTYLGIHFDSENEGRPLYRFHPRPEPPEFLGESQMVAYGAEIPLWELSLVASIPFLIWLTVYVRRRTIERHLLRTGHCRKCNYNLRASKDRCPECGTPIRE